MLPPKKYKLILMRSGQNDLQAENRFDGWVDADLTEFGIQEIQNAAQSLVKRRIYPDKIYTSVLKSAIKSVFYVQEEMDLHSIPVVRRWNLNERMYGALSGGNRTDAVEEYSKDLVEAWRYSYEDAPPLILEEEEFNPVFDRKYKILELADYEIPRTECLSDVENRMMPWIKNELRPTIRKGLTIMMLGHMGPILVLIKHFDKISDLAISKITIPTAIPLIYEFDENLKPIRHYYLATEEDVEENIQRVNVIPVNIYKHF